METQKNDYQLTVGIEVHAELKTRTKMFCGCANDPHRGEANTHVCPVCMGHPGTLPVVNKEAVESVLKVGIALGADTAAFTEFDRKNYFYPDIPKGYQISQYEYPLVKGGELAGVKITRVHLEEDTARSLHDQVDGSLVDYNRAGVPLMELVTEPVIHDSKTAGNFARELQLLFRTLGVSDANMEKGEMRVEANISISKTDKLGTKVEVKNLNSFKSVEGAIEYEIKRHTELLEKGEKILQETRGWDESKGKTFPQRIKETADDYRYFPEPDIPKFDIEKTGIVSRLNDIMPVLPAEKRIKYGNLGLTREQIEVILSDGEISKFFEQAVYIGVEESAITKLIANYLVSDVVSHINTEYKIANASVEHFVELMQMILRGEVTSRVAKDILLESIFGEVSPAVIAKERGLAQQNSADELIATVKLVIDQNVSVADEYRGGKEASLQFLIGMGMKATKGSANPAILKDLFISELKNSR